MTFWIPFAAGDVKGVHFLDEYLAGGLAQEFSEQSQDTVPMHKFFAES